MRIGPASDAIARGVPGRPRRVGPAHGWLGALAALTLLAGVFVLARVTVGLSPALSETYYDEALTGLMCLAILRGLPQVFYWGQPYLGAVDAYFAAAAFYIFGPSTLTLRLSVASLSALWVWAAWRIGRRVAGERWGLLAGLQVALPPIFLTHLQLSSHAEGVALTLGTVSLAAAISLLRSEPARSTRLEPWTWVVLGLTAGLAWWASQMATMLLIAAALGLLVARPAVLRGPWPYVALGLFAVASGPFWLWNEGHEWATFRHLLEWGDPLPTPSVRIEHVAYALVSSLRDTYWDGRAVPLPPWASRLGWFVVGAVYLPAVGLAASRLVVWIRRIGHKTRPWRDPLDLVALAFWLTVAAHLLTWFGSSGIIRYSVTFFGPLPLLVAAMLARLARLGRAGRAIAIGLGGALIGFNLFTHVAFLRDGAAGPVRPVDAVIARLESVGATACYADSRIAQVLSFESAGRIKCADYRGLRDYATLRSVDQIETANSVAIVTHPGIKPPDPTQMARGLTRIGATMEQAAVGDYVIFHHAFPPDPRVDPVPTAGWRARASSNADRAARAFDRQAWTRWWAPGRSGEWYELDLGRIRPITEVSLLAAPWSADAPPGLRVETSVDGVRWETAVTDPDLLPGIHWWKGHPRVDDGGLVIERFSPHNGRYVRLTNIGPQRAEVLWSIAELFVYETAASPWSPPTSAVDALTAARRELDHWMDDPTGPNPIRAPVTYEHRRGQVLWRQVFADADAALAAAPEWEEAQRFYGEALMRAGWGEGPERALVRARGDGAWPEVIRIAEMIDAEPDATWRAGRLEAWAEGLERLQRPAEAAAIRARPEPVPSRTVRVRFGQDLELVGVDAPREARVGETVRVCYYWRLLRPVRDDYWVFLHVPNWSDSPNHDQPVGELHYGPARWTVGERVRQTVVFTVPMNTTPGTYTLLAGVWLPSSGRHLPIGSSDLPQAHGAVDLAALTVVP
jgi:Dolichyl-phosphate-mannose-protein mannosyltransferase/F5/8 type C domain